MDRTSLARRAYTVAGDQHGQFHGRGSAQRNGAFPEQPEVWTRKDDHARPVDLFVNERALKDLGPAVIPPFC